MPDVRRKFVDAANVGRNSASAREAIAITDRIFAVERELAGWPRDEAFRVERARRVQPHLDRLSSWLEKKSCHVPPQTALGKAVAYTTGQWAKLIRYLECVYLSPDTNRVENAIRPVAVGKKIWLFAGSPRGANASMTLYSLIETAKANKVEPYWYLRTLFDRLPTFDPSGDYSQLFPWNISASDPDQA